MEGEGIAAGNRIIGTAGGSASTCSDTMLVCVSLHKRKGSCTVPKLPAIVTASQRQHSTCASRGQNCCCIYVYLWQRCQGGLMP